MSVFNRLVDHALTVRSDLAPLRVVVEKELLHHDILREMSAAGLMAGLTFVGGTCLRTCYGSNRLSEDLDFTGGQDFRRETLADLGKVLVATLEKKYGLHVEVGEPVREIGRVDTWKVKVVTRPEQRDSPAQRIHIDICAVPSHDRRPVLLRNPYDTDMGTAGLFVQAESREEILADKWLAFALRPNRLKNRDLWDIAWLTQQQVALPLDLVVDKIADRRHTVKAFVAQLAERHAQLRENPAVRDDFMAEMKRFLPARIVADTVEKPDFWPYLADLIGAEGDLVVSHLSGGSTSAPFRM
jgi:predicted nucleotidyltransferase component of viral defense system